MCHDIALGPGENGEGVKLTDKELEKGNAEMIIAKSVICSKLHGNSKTGKKNHSKFFPEVIIISPNCVCITAIIWHFFKYRYYPQTLQKFN